MLRFLLIMLLWNGVKVEKSDEEWRMELGRDRYCVMRKKATEPAYSGCYLFCIDEGVYSCAACQLALFHSSAKITSHGWIAFGQPIVQKHVWIKEDKSLPFLRYEVLCRGCDSHLGHVFRTANTYRYTINSIALQFEEDPGTQG